MNLNNHLNKSLQKDNEQVNESLILSAIICSACVAYAAAPVLNTDFMKSVGSGIGGLLSGIGGLFGNFGINKNKIDNIKELLKKDPDDLTGKEKELLKKYSKSNKLKKELSNNDLKALNNILGNTNKDDKEIEKQEDKEDNKYTPEMMSGLMLLAKKANESEKDKSKKEENEAMLNLLAACSYDKDGNEIPMEDRLEKMKDIVGEDRWDAFKDDMNKKYEENKDNEDFKKALENAKENISKKDIEEFIAETKKNAKTTLEKVEHEKKEQERIDKELEEINKQLKDKETDSEKINKLKEEVDKLKKEKENLVKQSVVGKASPNTVNSVINNINSDENKTDDKKNKPEKDKDGNIIKQEEIKDPKTGEKKKVITHTGPRGGKFYYPDGKPKKPENKVYVENKKYCSLSNYLFEKFNN